MTADPVVSPDVPPHGIKTILVETPVLTIERAFFGAAFLVIALFFVLLAVWFWTRGKRRLDAVVNVDPWKKICEDIDLFLAEKSQDASLEQVVSRASEVNLLTRRLLAFFVEAPLCDWTTQEIEKHWESLNLPSVIDGSLVLSLLKETDMVRFAGRGSASSTLEHWCEHLKTWKLQLIELKKIQVKSDHARKGIGGLRVF